MMRVGQASGDYVSSFQPVVSYRWPINLFSFANVGLPPLT